MFERFTDRARAALVRAQKEAVAEEQTRLSTGHLLIGLSDTEGIAGLVLADVGLGPAALTAHVRAATNEVTEDVQAPAPTAAASLAAFGIDLEAVRDRVNDTFGEGAVKMGGQDTAPLFTNAAKAALEHALLQALAWSHNYIGTEHVLAGALWDPTTVAARATAMAGVDAGALRVAALRRLTSSTNTILTSLNEWLATLGSEVKERAAAIVSDLADEIAAAYESAGTGAIRTYQSELRSAAIAATSQWPTDAEPPLDATSATIRTWFNARQASLSEAERLRFRDVRDEFEDNAVGLKQALVLGGRDTRTRLIGAAVERAMTAIRTAGATPPEVASD